MRTLLIMAGILLVCWLGYLTLQHVSMKTDMDNHHNELQEHDSILNGNYQNDEHIPYGKEMDRKEDKFDKKHQMPYENPKTNENTNLKKENNKHVNTSVEPVVPPASAEQPVKPNPVKEPAKKPQEPIKGKPQSNADDSIVAYAYVSNDVVNTAIEAFQLNLFPQEAVVAFKLQ